MSILRSLLGNLVLAPRSIVGLSFFLTGTAELAGRNGCYFFQKEVEERGSKKIRIIK